MTLCDNCKREPEEFTLPDGNVGYWFRVDKDGEPSFLMTDLEFSFCCVTEREPEREDGEVLWCVRCIESQNKEDNTHD